ncbi:hypothetical protein LX32DRAFT_51198 [Colletotrichum zoysiae]|uniref:Uncharacterized protein n=1 Tax=Colletotrichum zoysiae TaxID=1216348 RepID=A0AAD9HCW4_9PEZI|nr:hypothetical protein LX32DRAFT_51198 [Colletotrichum zoysiae]
MTGGGVPGGICSALVYIKVSSPWHTKSCMLMEARWPLRFSRLMQHYPEMAGSLRIPRIRITMACCLHECSVQMLAPSCTVRGGKVGAPCLESNPVAGCMSKSRPGGGGFGGTCLISHDSWHLHTPWIWSL